MKFLIQRVERASVAVEEEVTGEIGVGYLVLIGIAQTDTKEIADRMIKKMIGLRIFADADGRTNRSLADVGGGVLLVSQFTLYADTRKGNRPSFLRSGDPALAEDLYAYIVAACRRQLPIVETGKFAAQMRVELVNDGPFTVMLDSTEMGWDA